MFQRLCHMQPGSGIGLVGLGSVLLHQKEFVMARALLQKGKLVIRNGACNEGYCGGISLKTASMSFSFEKFPPH